MQRVLKFVKYLVEFGWEVKVLTTASLDYAVHDYSLVDEVPAEVEVVRAHEWPIPALRSALLNPLHRLRAPGLLKYVGWPDERCGWLPFAAREGLRLADRFRPDVVFTSSPHYSAHVVGRLLSVARGVPWVADFRDPWTQGQNQEDPRLLAAANRRMERSIVTHARYVTVVDDPIQLVGLPGTMIGASSSTTASTRRIWRTATPRSRTMQTGSRSHTSAPSMAGATPRPCSKRSPAW